MNCTNHKYEKATFTCKKCNEHLCAKCYTPNEEGLCNKCRGINTEEVISPFIPRKVYSTHKYRGWLLVPFIGLVLTIIFQTTYLLLRLETPYFGLLKLVSVIHIVLAIIIIQHWLKEKRSMVPWIMIHFVVSTLIFIVNPDQAIIEHFMVEESFFRPFFRDCFRFTILPLWIIYFLTSKRVKLIFIK